MRNPITCRLPMMAAFAVMIAGTTAYAAEKEAGPDVSTHATKSAVAVQPVPADAAGTVALANKKLLELEEVVSANKLADVHATAFEIRDALLTLPAKSKTLPADQQAALSAALNRIKQQAKLLDKYGDANDAVQTKAVLAKFKADVQAVGKIAVPRPGAETTSDNTTGSALSDSKTSVTQ